MQYFGRHLPTLTAAMLFKRLNKGFSAGGPPICFVRPDYRLFIVTLARCVLKNIDAISGKMLLTI
jgi:hypothetical protein